MLKNTLKSFIKKLLLSPLIRDQSFLHLYVENTNFLKKKFDLLVTGKKKKEENSSHNVLVIKNTSFFKKNCGTKPLSDVNLNFLKF